MSYFNNPHTEEELKEQYRKILSKHDYHNPQNEKFMNDIRKEYEETLMKIKRANGYRTPFEKITDSAKNYVKSEIKEYRAIKAAERERISNLQNHQYTKEECIESYHKVKCCLKQVIELMVKKFNTLLIYEINNLDNIGFYQWFNATTATGRYFAPTDSELKNYNSAREVLEYAIQSISEQTKTNYEKNLLEMEDSLGEYFKKYYRECCDKYVDPIKVAKAEMQAQKTQKENVFCYKLSCFLVVWTLFFIPFVLLSVESDMPMIISVLFPICLAYPIGSAISAVIIKNLKRTTYSTFAAKEQRARVTQRKTFENDRAAFQIFRLIRNILRF